MDSVGVLANADHLAAVVDASWRGGERIGAVDGRVGLSEADGRAQNQESQQEPDGQAAMSLPSSFGKLRSDFVHGNLLYSNYIYLTRHLYGGISRVRLNAIKRGKTSKILSYLLTRNLLAKPCMEGSLEGGGIN